VKILWYGNSPWSPSGYGGQAALFLPRIQALGHEVACVANWGLQGTATEWRGMPVFPAFGTQDNDAIPVWYEQYQPDVVLTLMDAWTLKPKNFPEVPLACWAPVDHYPLPPAVHGALKQPNVRPIAMSRFGEREMRKRKLDPLYVPHGVDTALFRPQPEIREGVRESMGLPAGAFVAGMVAANSSPGEFPRKGFGQAFQAFARFLERHDDAWLYCHTKMHGAMDLEALLMALAELHSPKLLERVKFPPPSIWYTGLPQDQLADMYCAFDVFLNPAMGEGFGIPIIEAQACGVPVIASDHSAMSELAQAGWLVGGDPWWDVAQSSFGYTASVDAIVAALELAHEARGDEELRASARQVARGYDADLVTVEHWEPALEALERPREVPPLAPHGNRAQRRAAAKQRARA
jgi:glycosyltransferase involved in cell wall biosynthesis